MAFSSSTVTVGNPTKKADYDRLMDNTILLYSGTANFTGQKNFNSATVFNHAPNWREAGRVLTLEGRSGTASTVTVKQYVKEIGLWDMSATDQVSRTANNITINQVVSIAVVIIHDTGVFFRDLLQDGDVQVAQAGTITLSRDNSGVFDAAVYNDPAINRGWVFLEYY